VDHLLIDQLSKTPTQFYPSHSSGRSRHHTTSISKEAACPLYMLRDKNFLPKSDEEEWTMLQALSVLYAYRPSGNGISIGDSTFEISQWTIKGYIEAYALHLAVHRSISALKASIRSGDPNITSSIGFKKYVYWLWLFNMSHQ
jgi:hypothetical protein